MMENSLYTSREAAKMLNVSASHLSRLLSEEDAPKVRFFGNRRMFADDDVTAIRQWLTGRYQRGRTSSWRDVEDAERFGAGAAAEKLETSTGYLYQLLNTPGAPKPEKHRGAWRFTDKDVEAIREWRRLAGAALRPTQDEDGNELLDTYTVAAQLGITKIALHQLLTNEGAPRGRKAGKYRVFTREDFMELQKYVNNRPGRGRPALGAEQFMADGKMRYSLISAAKILGFADYKELSFWLQWKGSPDKKWYRNRFTLSEDDLEAFRHWRITLPPEATFGKILPGWVKKEVMRPSHER